MKKVYSDTGPFAIIPEWLLLRVSARAVHIYAFIARCADMDGHCYPSRKYLSDRAGCSVETVDRAISELVNMDALIVEARVDKEFGRRSNYYTVLRREPDYSAPPHPQKQDTPLVAHDEQNESQVNESSASVDHSENALPQPLPVAAFKNSVIAYLAADAKSRVARLVDIGDSLGYERNGGFAAALVREFHDKVSNMKIVDAMVAGITAKGDPWAYVRKALDGEARRTAWSGQRGVQPAEGTGEGFVSVSQEEVDAALKAKADEAASAGAGPDAGQGAPGVLPGPE